MPHQPYSALAPVLFLSHGGGPLPLLGDPQHKPMVDVLQRITPSLGKPAAILVISAHWEESIATISSGANPELIYDYYGFAEESYAIKYPAAGAPALANKVFSLLQKQGIDAQLDNRRGFDHGLFVPLKIIYPQADIPCIQLSLLNNLDAAQHIKIGKALTALRKEHILIIGSGFSFHNMKAFFTAATTATRAMNEAFEQWLADTCSNIQLTEIERELRLIDWERAPAARYCHPREEHLLPLHVCYGVAGSAAKQVFHCEILNQKASFYLW